jgi:hypothetical protein
MTSETIDGELAGFLRPPCRGALPGLVVAGVVAAAVPALLWVEMPPMARTFLTLLLLLWAPGHAIAAVTHVHDPLTVAVLAFVGSVCVDIAVATALLYVGAWDANRFTALVGAATVTLAVLGSRGGRRCS